MLQVSSNGFIFSGKRSRCHSSFSHLHALSTKWHLDVGSHPAQEGTSRRKGQEARGSFSTPELLTSASSGSPPHLLFCEDEELGVLLFLAVRVSTDTPSLVAAMLQEEGCLDTGSFGAVQRKEHHLIPERRTEIGRDGQVILELSTEERVSHLAGTSI